MILRSLPHIRVSHRPHLRVKRKNTRKSQPPYDLSAIRLRYDRLDVLDPGLTQTPDLPPIFCAKMDDGARRSCVSAVRNVRNLRRG
jgi:hypothetical protein